ncbi:MAG: hypothetical protein SOW20_05645 [Berryella intestinalis]|uniref:hypothetical protein n=1 Tax=Berryella intestinalis TaxID=1531429 RepID=UPI002A58C1D3|nr:hypothetical protein [Berryella intestinalis]MDD7368938.1 hypothetical protein [Berryella intestinalis]MDY3129489.1 hypothetical protein [Berryella intestinalis]
MIESKRNKDAKAMKVLFWVMLASVLLAEGAAGLLILQGRTIERTKSGSSATRSGSFALR